jgi:hypothetical protein
MIALLFSHAAVAAWVGAAFAVSRQLGEARRNLRKHALLFLWAAALILVHAAAPGDTTDIERLPTTVGECAGGFVAWIQAGEAPFA